MLKNTLVLLMLYCAFVEARNFDYKSARQNMHNRLKNRVVHIELDAERARWLWQNSGNGLWIDPLPERETYFKPAVQFKVTECGQGKKYLCFESVSRPHHYVKANTKDSVKLVQSNYVHNDNGFQWKVLCQSVQMKMCTFVPVRFESDGRRMIADNSVGGGHYAADLETDPNPYVGWFIVHAPNPSDKYKQVYSNRNTGSVNQDVEYSTSIGVSQTESTTHSVTTEVSVEIEGAFKAFSADVSASISHTWENAHSSTFEKAKTVTHKLTVPPRTMIVLKQLVGNYAGRFDVADDQYEIEETPLDGGKKVTKAVQANSVYIKL